MANMLDILDHRIPVRKDSASATPLLVGDLTRAFSGYPLTNYRAIKGVWSAKTPLMAPDEAKFLIALLQGRGHVWNFDIEDEYLYSSKGLYPSAGAAQSAWYDTTVKFGNGAIAIDDTDQVEWEVGYTNEWTAMCWRHATNLSLATHYIINSEGEKWVDGVRNDAASIPFLDVDSDGVFILGQTSSVGGTQKFDDVAVIDEKITDAWAEDLGVAIRALPPWPAIRAKGALVGNRTVQCLGGEVSWEFAMGTLDGVFYNDLMSVSFSLNERQRI